MSSQISLPPLSFPFGKCACIPRFIFNVNLDGRTFRIRLPVLGYQNVPPVLSFRIHEITIPERGQLAALQRKKPAVFLDAHPVKDSEDGKNNTSYQAIFSRIWFDSRPDPMLHIGWNNPRDWRSWHTTKPLSFKNIESTLRRFIQRRTPRETRDWLLSIAANRTEEDTIEATFRPLITA